jgi:hypothetical protein
MESVVKLLLSAIFALASSSAFAQYLLPDAPPPPQPLGWVFTRYTVCPEPHTCPVVYVSVGADGLNVRAAGPDSPTIMALINGTPLVVLQRQGSWTLVAPACDLIPTGLWSWTAGVPLSRCYVWFP